MTSGSGSRQVDRSRAPSRRGSPARRWRPRWRPRRRADDRTAPSCPTTGTVAARAPSASRDRPRFGEVADRGRGRVGVHVVDLGRVDRGVREGDRRRAGRLAAVGPWLDHVMRVRRGAVAEELGIRASRRAASATSAASSTRSAAPSPMTNPSRPTSKGRAAAGRVVVVAGRERADDVERSERQRAQRDLAAAGDRGVDPALAQVAQRLTQRHRSGGARVRGRQDRPADPKRDPEVGGRGTAEHGEREVRSDLRMPRSR